MRTGDTLILENLRIPPVFTSEYLYDSNECVCRKHAGQALVMTGTNALQTVLVLKQDTLSR